MERTSVDVLVAGGGVAGLTATAAFAAAGFGVLCVDPVPPVVSAEAEGADLRSTAFLAPAVALLRRAGLWEGLAPEAAPLRVMRIADAGGEEGVIREVADFAAEEIGAAVDYGVVKMNVDTDTQYAFTRPVVDHMLRNYDGVLKIDGEVGNKKQYDPRSWGKAAEAGMAARIVEACENLRSAGTSVSA